MALQVTRYLNKTVFVSIPALFEDSACRAHRLLGIELNGLWLQSDELTERLLPRDHEQLASYTPMVFVPFAQIAGVMVATSPAPSDAPNGATSADTGSDKPTPAKAPAESKPRRRTTKKTSSGQ